MTQKTRSPQLARLRVLAICTLFAPALAQAAAELPTQSFRDEHREVKKHLAHVAQWVGQLRTQQPAAQRETAERVATFFEKEIGPHAAWEEAHLYPVIDRLAGTREPNRFTSTMRYEHKVVGRWMAELRAELKKPSPDYVAFSRRADNLLGLLSAHFEEEEEVLLPYADKQLTRAQFEQAVGGKEAKPGTGHP